MNFLNFMSDTEPRITEPPLDMFVELILILNKTH
jgi:hypothetical protein